MIARVADPGDKEGIKTKIIGMYVPIIFKDTIKPNGNFRVELDLTDAPVGFYFDDDDIKYLIYKNKQTKPNFQSYSAQNKGKESGIFFGVAEGFSISNNRLSRDFNNFKTDNWEFP